jgi:hypothetical protein
MRRNVKYIFPPPILKKRRKRGHCQSEFINAQDHIPFNTGLVQTHQSPVESARMPALFLYFKLCGRFQFSPAKLKIVRKFEICVDICAHVRTYFRCAHISKCAHISTDILKCPSAGYYGVILNNFCRKLTCSVYFAYISTPTYEYSLLCTPCCCPE